MLRPASARTTGRTSGPRAEVLTADRTGALLGWSDTALRDLPWRHTRDPWAVLVSEVMLQQTQVARVRERYEAFLARFPDPSSCASAPLSEVVRAWEGLGYNLRAVRLHAASRAVVDDHGGEVPSDLAGLESLAGVGLYTARAVAVHAFEQDLGVVDTNVARVLARWHGERLTAAELAHLADETVPPGAAWRWSQALMDLGATVCTGRAPACSSCPVASWCRWRRDGNPLPDPAAPRRRQSTFAGSDRQGRGRLVAQLRRGPLPRRELAQAMGWPGDPARVERVVAQLVDEGLVEIDGGIVRLPG